MCDSCYIVVCRVRQALLGGDRRFMTDWESPPMTGINQACTEQCQTQTLTGFKAIIIQENL